jgi:hypothetical protein
MASSKDTFEPKTFAANSFAAGVFRGIGTAVGQITAFAGTITIEPRFAGAVSCEPRLSGSVKVN